MHASTSPLALLQSFCRREDGHVSALSILTTLSFLAITGTAVDVMRFEAERIRMQSAMDRAVLAAADLDQVQLPAEVVQNYLDKAGLGGALHSVEVTGNLNHRTVMAKGQDDFDVLFMSGATGLQVQASSEAEEKISNVEISLALDISGSMRWNNRDTHMRDAAEAFVNKVLTEENAGVTTLNLVPFAGHVNPGNTLFRYFRGERPKIKQNNGWGNGDQDAPGNSLCNNNAENAYEGSQDPSCLAEGENFNPDTGHFEVWSEAISNVVYYFDTDGDGIYDRAHKVKNFPSDAPRDADDFFKGTVAFLIADNAELTDPNQFLGASIRAGKGKALYFQVKGNENGAAPDLGPTKNKGRIPGNRYDYSAIDHAAWEDSYVTPNIDKKDAIAAAQDLGETNSEFFKQNINMPSSCVEIYTEEFGTTDIPKSDDYVPHFSFWSIDHETMDWGWCPDNDSSIQYYSDNAAQLVDFIKNMRLHDGTGIQYGMKYALSLLDPGTRDAVSYLVDEGMIAPKFRGRPIDWHDPETQKYIVLMSDGGVTDQFRPSDPRDTLNGEVALQDQGGASYYTMKSRAANRDDLIDHCRLAHAHGVTVFTIAFETNESAATDLRNCASSPSHFFHVKGSELTDTFDVIARQINNLRLIQ